MENIECLPLGSTEVFSFGETNKKRETNPKADLPVVSSCIARCFHHKVCNHLDA